jgi:hypothetical protein
LILPIGAFCVEARVEARVGVAAATTTSNLQLFSAMAASSAQPEAQLKAQPEAQPKAHHHAAVDQGRVCAQEAVGAAQEVPGPATNGGQLSVAVIVPRSQLKRTPKFLTFVFGHSKIGNAGKSDENSFWLPKGRRPVGQAHIVTATEGPKWFVLVLHKGNKWVCAGAVCKVAKDDGDTWTTTMQGQCVTMRRYTFTCIRAGEVMRRILGLEAKTKREMLALIFGVTTVWRRCTDNKTVPLLGSVIPSVLYAFKTSFNAADAAAAMQRFQSTRQWGGRASSHTSQLVSGPAPGSGPAPAPAPALGRGPAPAPALGRGPAPAPALGPRSTSKRKQPHAKTPEPEPQPERRRPRMVVGPNGVGPKSVGPNGVSHYGVGLNGVGLNGAGYYGVGHNSVGPKSVGHNSVGHYGVSYNGVGPNSVGHYGVGPNSVGHYGVSQNGVGHNGVSSYFTVPYCTAPYCTAPYCMASYYALHQSFQSQSPFIGHHLPYYCLEKTANHGGGFVHGPSGPARGQMMPPLALLTAPRLAPPPVSTRVETASELQDAPRLKEQLPQAVAKSVPVASASFLSGAAANGGRVEAKVKFVSSCAL